MRELRCWTHTEDKVNYHGEFRSIESTIRAAENYYAEGDLFFLCSVHQAEISDFFDVDKLVEGLQCQAQEEVASLDSWLEDLSKGEVFDLRSMVSKTLKNWAKEYNKRPPYLLMKQLGVYKISEGKAVSIDLSEAVGAQHD